MTSKPTVLDPAQLKRIEAVHRGFLYQHLVAAGCLLRAAAAGVTSIAVETDEDVEVTLRDRQLYLQIKTRAASLTHGDIAGALQRFSQIRQSHARGERKGTASFIIISNAAPGVELTRRIEAKDWPADIRLSWPDIDLGEAALPTAWKDISEAFADCMGQAKALPFGVLSPETLVWKLAGQVMSAAAGVPPRTNHRFAVEELPSVFEQLVIQMQDFPAPPPLYRPQADEPELLATKAPLRMITGFSGAGKTAWVSQAAQHTQAELAYFDVGDIPGPAIAIPLARELAARFFGRGGGLGEILLPGSTGLEMLRILDGRLRARGIAPIVVVDNAHRAPADSLHTILQQAPTVRFLFLCQPGATVQELEATLGVAPEPLNGWNTDTIAAEASSNNCVVSPSAAQRLLTLTAGLPLYVQNAMRIAAQEYAGYVGHFCEALERQTHSATTAQEIILAKVFAALSVRTHNAVAVLSLCDISLDRSEAVAALNSATGTDDAGFAVILRELRAAGLIEIFGGTRLKLHDAIRVLGQGNRAKKSAPNETCQVVVVPTGNLAADAQGIFLAG
jgi:hypothetical protein